MSLARFKGVAFDVEKLKMKTLEREERKVQSDERQSVSNILFLVIVIAMAFSVSVYICNVAVRVYRLEQRFEVMSHRCDGLSASARPVTGAPRSSWQRQTRTVTESPTTSSSVATKSSTSTLSMPKTNRDWYNYWQKTLNDIDGGLKTHANSEVGSGLLEDEDDDDDGDRSGDDASHESYVSQPWAHKFIGEWYQFGLHSRHKRSADAAPVSDDSATSRRRHHHRQQQQQQQQQHGRRRGAGHRATSNHDLAESNPADNARQHQRRRDRRKSERRRQRLETTDDDTTTNNTQITSLKAVHFYAPRGPEKHHRSGHVPPATFPFWRADNWTMSQTDWFSLNDEGILTILQSGIYMVYAQLVYHDLSGRWSFGIFVSERERVKCMNTEQIDASRHHRASTSHGVYQQCYTSAVLQLNRYDAVSIRCLYGSRSVVMQPEFTFWGLVQLSSTHTPASP